MTEWSAAYTREDGSGVWVRTDRPAGHDYSDGEEAERYILECVEAAGDLSPGSDELVRCIRDWPSEYHFSASRSTLLLPFDFEGLTVLEVGCGCGALTRALAENAAHVVALEGSPVRARITAARCRGQANVDVLCDDFRTFESSRRFDAVLFIGVLEYAPLYFPDADPVVAALRKASARLCPGGAIVVAIENQLGLKYFAGCTEDHSGELFFGVEDRYGEARGPVTFGRCELDATLSRAGLPYTRFYYPFPDYKLPKMIVTEAGAADPDLHAGRLAAGFRSRDYRWEHPRLFAEEATWDVIDRNGLTAALSNSFLVVAGKGDDVRLGAHDEWLAAIVTADRARAFRTLTEFVRPDGQLVVRKRLLHPESRPLADAPVRLSLPSEERFHDGRPLGWHVRRVLRSATAQVDDLVECLLPWLRFLEGQRLPDGGAPDAAGRGPASLPGALLDAVPWNLMMTDDPQGAPTPFDLEWGYVPALRLDHVLFRGLFAQLAEARGELRLFAGDTVGEAIAALMRALDVPVDDERTSEIVEREAEIQSVVFGLDIDAVRRRLQATLAETALGDGGLGITLDQKNRQIDGLRSAIADLQGSLAVAEADRDRLTENLRRVEGSLSWRVTAPLRSAKGFAGRRRDSD